MSAAEPAEVTAVPAVMVMASGVGPGAGAVRRREQGCAIRAVSELAASDAPKGVEKHQDDASDREDGRERFRQEASDRRADECKAQEVGRSFPYSGAHDRSRAIIPGVFAARFQQKTPPQRGFRGWAVLGSNQ
jgi:hypothetical protein